MIVLHEENKEFIQKAKDYAIKCHKDVNHFYDRAWPYAHHLQMAVDVFYECTKANVIMWNPVQEKIIVSAIWGHDLIEDTRQNYNDVKQVLGLEIADIIYAVSEEKGRNREERQNDKYYDGIYNTKYATIVKLCDRIANTQYSVDSKSNMIKKYKQEYPKFRQKLYSKVWESDWVYEEFWNRLDKITNG